MPREHYKSTICSESLPLWLLIRDPNTTIALVSAHSDNTKKWLRGLKQTIQYNSFFRWLFPEIRPGNKWDEEEITISRDKGVGEKAQASITAYSIRSGLASQHHRNIICDDLVNEQVAKSQVEMETALYLFHHLEEILEGWYDSNFWVIGTPWGREDVIAETLEYEREGTWLKWGVGALGEFTISDSIKDRSELVPQVTPGRPILPSACPMAKLEYKKRQNLEEFYLQYLCKPFDEGRNGFDLDLIRDFVVFPDGRIACDCHPGHLHRLQDMAVAGVSDPAYTEDKKNCESSIIFVAKAPCNCRFMLSEWGGHVNPNDYVLRACELTHSWVPYVKKFAVEEVNFQVALKHWLLEMQNLPNDRGDGTKFPMGVEVCGVKPKRREKDVRISGQQTPVANGWWHKRPFMHRTEGKNSLIEQLAKWPYSRMRDRIDAWAYCDDAWETMSTAPAGTPELPDSAWQLNAEIEQRDTEEYLKELMLETG